MNKRKAEQFVIVLFRFKVSALCSFTFSLLCTFPLHPLSASENRQSVQYTFSVFFPRPMKGEETKKGLTLGAY